MEDAITTADEPLTEEVTTNDTAFGEFSEATISDVLCLPPIPLKIDDLPFISLSSPPVTPPRDYTVAPDEVYKLFDAVMECRESTVFGEPDVVEEVSNASINRNRPALYRLHRDNFIRQQYEQERRRRYLSQHLSMISRRASLSHLTPPVLNHTIEIRHDFAHYPYLARRHIIIKLLNVLDLFSTHRYSEDEDTNEKCTICLSNFEEHESIRTLNCLHKFHRKCVDPWLMRSFVCPLCRRVMDGNVEETFNKVFTTCVILHNSCSCDCFKTL